MQTLESSWRSAWQVLDAQPPHGLLERLLQAYTEPARKYHTLQHLRECVQQLAAELHTAAHPGEVAVALWFHDAVYDVKGQHNEPHSAQWAQRELAGAGVSPDVAARVFALVMATAHAALPATPDQRLLVDVDLSILGAPPARFAEYEAQIRDEYAWVPGWVFRRKRRAILADFLHRPQIYSTEAFRQRCEAQARHNIQLALGGV